MDNDHCDVILIIFLVLVFIYFLISNLTKFEVTCLLNLLLGILGLYEAKDVISRMTLYLRSMKFKTIFERALTCIDNCNGLTSGCGLGDMLESHER